MKEYSNITKSLLNDIEKLIKKYSDRYNKHGFKSDRANKRVLQDFLTRIEQDE